MSREFLNRNHQNYSGNNPDNTVQKKIDIQTQLDRVNNQKIGSGWGEFNNLPAGRQGSSANSETTQKIAEEANNTMRTGDPEKHIILQGDTYWDISKNSRGKFSVEDLKRWNPGVDWNNLQIGDQINISPPQSINSFEKVTKDFRENGFNVFMQYINNPNYGVDYFIENCRKIEFERSGWLAKVIEMSPPTKDAFHIVAWRDSMISDGTPEVNALEHQIGTFLIGAKYGEEMAELIPAMNEVRGLIINDRQNGLMLEALGGSDNTAFTWGDVKHNKEGLKNYKEWHKKQEAERISKIKRFSKEWCLEIAKRIPID